MSERIGKGEGGRVEKKKFSGDKGGSCVSKERKRLGEHTRER